jgi:phosphotransferase system  glucose/maltose/N-acetylglucosamine-specific IIC component
VARRIALALAGGLLVALLWTTGAVAGSGLDLAAHAQIDRGRYPTSGFEIALMAIGVAVLVAIGFLLRYLARPKKPKDKKPEEKTPKGEAQESRASKDNAAGDES